MKDINLLTKTEIGSPFVLKKEQQTIPAEAQVALPIKISNSHLSNITFGPHKTRLFVSTISANSIGGLIHFKKQIGDTDHPLTLDNVTFSAIDPRYSLN